MLTGTCGQSIQEWKYQDLSRSRESERRQKREERKRREREERERRKREGNSKCSLQSEVASSGLDERKRLIRMGKAMDEWEGSEVKAPSLPHSSLPSIVPFISSSLQNGSHLLLHLLRSITSILHQQWYVSITVICQMVWLCSVNNVYHYLCH